MAKKQVVYLVVQRTGLHDKEGVELVIPVTARLTRTAADQEAAKLDNGDVQKLTATQE